MNTMSALEDAFVNVTFDEVSSTDDIHSTSDTMKETATPFYQDYIKHSSAQRVESNTFLTSIIRAMHPDQSIVVIPDYFVNLFGFPDATITPVPKTEILSRGVYFGAARRGQSGLLAENLEFGTFKVQWAGYTFLLYIVTFSEHVYDTTRQFYFIHDGPKDPINNLITASANWSNELHDEILVFNQGFWQKDHSLWEEVQKANWADVILDPSFKKRVKDDVEGFFNSEKIYRELAIPWKRGVIFLGPPGNGKTISLKAIMKSCPHPSLYVKTFTSWMGEEASIQEVFKKARQQSPCILVLEDLDSLINDGNRSFFLNEIDGMGDNDGILVIGTTNYFEKLDPSISKRPSRFDRKFSFEAPDRAERILYVKYWQHKLHSNKAIPFPDELVDKIADLTKGFSFAFMKESFVSTLILLAGNSDLEFEETLEAQIDLLRKTIDDSPNQSIR